MRQCWSIVQTAQDLRQLTGGELACSTSAVRVGRQSFHGHLLPVAECMPGNPSGCFRQPFGLLARTATLRVACGFSWLRDTGSWLLAPGSWLLATGNGERGTGNGKRATLRVACGFSWLLATGYWLLATGNGERGTLTPTPALLRCGRCGRTIGSRGRRRPFPRRCRRRDSWLGT